MRRGILIHVAKGDWFEKLGVLGAKTSECHCKNGSFVHGLDASIAKWDDTSSSTTGNLWETNVFREQEKLQLERRVGKIPIPALDPSVPSFDQGILNQWHQSWLVVWNMNFIFPYIGNNHPNWLMFFRVETTNQRGYYGISPVLGFDTGDQPLTPMHGMFPEKTKQQNHGSLAMISISQKNGFLYCIISYPIRMCSHCMSTCCLSWPWVLRCCFFKTSVSWTLRNHGSDDIPIGLQVTFFDECT